MEGDLRAMRARLVEHMQETLAKAKPADIPHWALALGAIPIYFWEMGKVCWRVLVATVINILVGVLQIITAVPVGIYILIDMLMLCHWFMLRILGRLSGRE